MEDGETLWGIAREFDVTVDAVRAANELDEDDTIHPGQTLRIPRSSSGSSTASSTSAARESGSRTASAGSSGERQASTENASGQRRTGGSEARPALSTVNRMPASTRNREHTVGDGETLWGIARRYDTTVENLRRANDLDEDDQIQPGQKLRIPNN